MAFDIRDRVVDNNTGKLLFQGSPEETVNFLNHLYPALYELVHVVRGNTLERMTVDEYFVLYRKPK